MLVKKNLHILVLNPGEVTNMQDKRIIKISVTTGDALTCRCDVLALKYAQALYGVDEAVVNKLSDSGEKFIGPLPPSAFRVIASKNKISAKTILFVGVKPLRQFGYPEIRDFGRRVLVALAGEKPETKQISLTIHGPGYGLDEIESFEAELAGLLDAIKSRDFPDALQTITFIEQNRGRAERLQ
jgi:hypothetical protein